MENYRPISVFPSFSKIIEGVVCLHLMHYLEIHSVLSAAQNVFRTLLSTELAYQDVVNYIYSIFDKENFTLWVFIDLAKGFDTLESSLLLKK